MYHQIPPPITTTARMIQIHGMSAPVAAGVACAEVRGVNSFYHYNAIQTWRLTPDGVLTAHVA
jgi:hypothetical protein